MKTIALKIYLFVAGLVLMLVGGYIGVSSAGYAAAMLGADVQLSLNLLSDLRGMGGMLLVFGLYAVAAVFRAAWQPTALLVTVLIYASYAVFRTLGFVLDGLPDAAILVAYAIEVVLLLWGLILLRSSSGHPVPDEYRPG